MNARYSEVFSQVSDVFYQSKTLKKVNLLDVLYKFLISETGLFIYDILDFRQKGKDMQQGESHNYNCRKVRDFYGLGKCTWHNTFS